MDLTGAVWRKASRSGSNGTHCVEAAARDQAVAVRDSKDRTGPALAVGERGWRTFLSAVKGGRLGL